MSHGCRASLEEYSSDGKWLQKLKFQYQTPCKYILAARYTFAEKKLKIVILAVGAGQQALTITFVKILNSTFLPMQLIYQGKTSQSFPKLEFPSLPELEC